MERNEDNVCGETTRTETVAVANGAMAQGKEDVSAVLGKFKDVNALANAYSALEAEFTRRSQRLKELEKLRYHGYSLLRFFRKLFHSMGQSY